MKKIIFIFLLFPLILFSQDIDYAKYVIDSLCSPAFKGRGYTFNGDSLAANFIANQLKDNRLKPVKGSYFQEFPIMSNVFADDMEVILNKKKLLPGKDYIINTKSNSIDGKFKVCILNAEIIKNNKKYEKFKRKNFENKFILIDTTNLNKPEFNSEYKKIVDKNSLQARGIITYSKKLTYIPSIIQKDFVHIIIKKNIINYKIRKIKVKIDAKQIKNYKTRNVIGKIDGKVDSFVVITAHYDHIGTMGKETFFPGAHDNASGCAMTLNLAKYFANIRCIPHYTLVFIFFSGEEIGLFGSKYFTENPLIPLDKIRFLINLDLMGSGEDGVQIVNSTVFIDEYKLMLEQNKKYELLPILKKRGPAANSDHYFFYKKGVPSFFIYSLGAYKEYHNIRDNRENIPLSGYENMFKLFKHFILNLKS